MNTARTHYMCPAANCNADMTDRVYDQCGESNVVYVPMGVSKILFTLASKALRTPPRPRPATKLATSVLLQCPNGHWAEYFCAAGAEQGESRLLSDAEVKQIQNLQALFDPGVSLKRIDDFAKWIFGSIAVVGTLGAGLSNSAFSTLAPCGKEVFGAAILMLGVSLFAATMAIEPSWVHANTASRKSMMAAVDANIRARRLPLRAAGTLFALALMTAALAPIVSLWCGGYGRQAQVFLGYDLKADGKLTGQATASRLRPSTPIELSFVATDTSKQSMVPRARKIADEKGQATLTIDLDAAAKLGSDLVLVVSWGDSPSSGWPLPYQQTIHPLDPRQDFGSSPRRK